MAVEKNCFKITLEVPEGNIPAKNSYIKFGFKDCELDTTCRKAIFWEKVAVYNLLEMTLPVT